MTQNLSDPSSAQYTSTLKEIKPGDTVLAKTDSDTSLDDSEESYKPLYSSDEIVDFLTFLNYNTKWFCLATFSNVLLFSIVVFRVNVLSQMAGHNTLFYLAFKYGLITFVISHIFACIFMSLGCFEEVGCEQSWTDKMKKMLEFKTEKQKILNYMWCILYSINTVTSMGLLGASNANFKEQLVTTVLMFCGIYLIHGLFLGAFTSVQIETYRRHSVFSYRFELITSYLATELVSKRIKRKIREFYIAFWKRKAALRRSTLLDNLPSGIKDRVLLDKYWEALNSSNVVKNTSPAFKRALANKMYSEIYTAGEIIYAQDNVKNVLMYVAKGSVQILSGDDTESTLLILGMGSCLGDISLIYSLENPVQVVSTSFSVVFCLKKADLWRTARMLKLTNPSKKIHAVVKSKIRTAILRQNYKKQHQMNFQGTLALTNDLTGARVNGNSTNDFNVYIREEAISNLYVITKDADYSQHDGIFIRTTFPWVLRPSSEFLFVWESFFVVLVGLVAIFYPWQTMSNTGSSKISYIFKSFVCLSYTVDYIIRMCTAVEDDKGVCTKFSDLIANKCSNFGFIFDIVALLPFEFTGIARFMRLNRVLMTYRVVLYIRRIENSFKVNVAIVRCAKYVIYLLYISYCTAVIYYMSACYNGCLKDTWVDAYKKSPYFSDQTLMFETAMMYAMLLVSGTGGRVIYRRLEELIIITAICVIGALVVSYLISDYSATLTLNGRTHYLYIEMVAVVRKFMQDTHMPQSIQNRMNHYLEAQWIHNKGLTINKLLKDAPQYLYEEYQVAKYGSILENVPLFQELDEDVLVDIAAHCETVFFPPNEFVSYSREIVKEMYVVEKGFCEIISPASGRIEKVIGPGAMFSVIDMILELPGVFHVRTVTHVSLIKITLETLKKALRTEDKAILHRLVEETKQSFTVQRLFTESTARMIQKVVEEDVRSWIPTPSRADPRREEYLNSWKVFRFCRYFMLPYTIMPCGRFIAYYEVFRAVCAFVSSLVLPASYVCAYYMRNFWIAQGFLDFCAYADIYLRLHVCYYNHHGVLVTHPKATAFHYLCGSFLIDFLGCLPTDYFLTFFWKNNFEDTAAYERMCAILRLNRIVQVYRIPDAFALFTRDIMQSKHNLVLFTKLISLSIGLQSLLCGIFMIFSCTLTEYTSAIVPEPGSWIKFLNYPLNFSSPYHIYLITYYFVCSHSMGMGYEDIFTIKRHEIILDIIIIIAGYLWFTYVLVIISNNKAVINVNLTLYQNHMKQFISFMKREKINKELQREAINHFEYVWQRCHGLRASKILKQCHLALSKDCALHLYEETLKEVPIFKDMVTSFYRVVGTNLDEQYFLRNYRIISLNDIINKIYIVHKGQVKITGPDGGQYTILTKGGVFGNIDDVTFTRSMIRATALSMVDLLVAHTDDLYSLISGYPVVVNRLKKHILLENLSYIESHYPLDEQDTEIKKTYMSKLMKILCSGELKLAFMLAALLSILSVSYQVSFKDYSLHHFGITYFLDAVHIVKIYFGFMTPYENHMGDLVVDKKLIMKAYLKFSKFYIELIGTFPTELLYFALPMFKLRGLTIFRLNRLVRITCVYNYFNIKHDYLNINVLLIKLSSIFIYLTVLIHAQACIWYLMACPDQCAASSWVYSNDTSVCDKEYLCSLYAATNLATFTGFSPPHARTEMELLVATVLMIFDKFALGIFIGYMTSIVHNVSSTLVRYDHGIKKLKEFLKHSKISVALGEIVLTYTYQLWNRNKGRQVPTYLTVCPAFIQENIKIAAFGYHIYENEIFMKCHSDFLRLLIGRLKVTTFFNGNIICQQGDVNHTMYFIHQGGVNVYKVNDAEEILIDQLQELDSFGILQGLIEYTPHTYTYVARNVTIILTLLQSDWKYLLTFFPASAFTIYSKRKHDRLGYKARYASKVIH
ncbi:hypothetical protein Trydic_g12202 [Trypoxylus dichotomus]